MVNNKKKNLATLAIDIGGTAIKMMVLNAKGLPLTDYICELTPQPATFTAVCRLITKMIQHLPVKFDRISAGFPGVIQHGIIKTAANMHPSWVGVAFQKKLAHLTGCPVKVANDADIQGLGDVSGNGVELVITLGTGVGSALFLNGKLVPNLELGHHPFQDNYTYEELLGKDALQQFGVATWRKNLRLAIALLQRTFNFDKLYLGGGNSHKINFVLPRDVKISDNIAGVLGGIKLWEQ